jgi:hypothetical protein
MNTERELYIHTHMLAKLFELKDAGGKGRVSLQENQSPKGPWSPLNVRSAEESLRTTLK